MQYCTPRLRRFGLILTLAATLIPLTPVRAAETTNPSLQSLGGDIAWDTESGLVEFVSFPEPVASTTFSRASSDPETIARTFLATYGTPFGLSAVAGRADTSDLTTQRVAASAGGSHAVRFQQTQHEIPVLGGELQVNLDPADRVTSVNGELIPAYTGSVEPAVSAADATASALAVVARRYQRPLASLSAKPQGLWLSNPRILGGPGFPVTTLNYRYEVRDGARVRALVLIDAQSGAVTLVFNQIAHALSQRVCDGLNRPDTDGNQNTDCASDSQAARLDQATDIGNSEVDTAWNNAKATYDYFSTVLGRDSIDDEGMKIISLVNYCPDAANCPYENAFWDGVQMTYGATYASADDVVAHELTHGVTQYTARLYYYYQSGAINESLSDIFGEFVDQHYTGPSGDAVPWLMGEDLPVGAIRSMSTPGLFGHPDKMTSTNYNTGLYLGESYDQGGVHSNSGVGNKTAYLLAAGGVFNGYTVAALGNDKTANIFYRTLTHYLTSASDYADLGRALVAACSALTTEGTLSITTADCNAVKNAVLATEMAKTPPNAPASDAPTCTTAETQVFVYNDTYEPVVASRWQATPATGSDWYLPAPAAFRYATSGINNLALLYPGGNRDQRYAMTSGFYVTPGTVFSFRHAYDFEAYYTEAGAISTSYDGGLVEYSTNGGTTWTDAKALFSTNGYNATLSSARNTSVIAGHSAFTGFSRGYITSRLNLDRLAGSNVRFRFRGVTDSFVAFSGWFIDDVQAYRCLTSTQAANQIDTTAEHGCLTTYAGTAWCWGRNTTGQLGTGTTTNATKAQSVRKAGGAPLTAVASVATSAGHSCALSTTGGVWCWGANTTGQLGDGTTTRRTQAVAVKASDGSALSGQKAIALGAAHTCALATGGTVSCWGANAAGELGDGTRTARRSPVVVEIAGGTPLTAVSALSAGDAHTCALRTDGTVWCWGNGSSGALGTTKTGTAGAVQVTTSTGKLTGITRISAGAQYTCAIAGTTATWCWGANRSGQLGDGATANRFFAVAVKSATGPLKNLVDIAAGRGTHTCGLLATGGVVCWGTNSVGQLGDGTTIQRLTATPIKPTAATTIGPARDIVVGVAHTCIRTNGGAVWCWGKNDAGQLADGTLLPNSAPVRVRNAVGVYGE